MRTKALPKVSQDAARAFTARIVKDDFAGNVTAAARAFGISQAMLYEFLQGTRGAGTKLLEGVAAHAKTTVDAVMGRSVPEVVHVPLNRHRDWPKARAEAERMHPEIPVEYLDLVGRGHVPGEPLESIDGVLVAGLAREWAAAAARVAARRRSAT